MLTDPGHPAPMSDTATKEDIHPGPQRHLDARLADAIRDGKEATGLSWRGLAAVTRSEDNMNIHAKAQLRRFRNTVLPVRPRRSRNILISSFKKRCAAEFSNRP